MTFEQFLEKEEFDPKVEYSGHYELLKACWGEALLSVSCKCEEVIYHKGYICKSCEKAARTV